jgi:hypothetical protein
MNTVPAACRRRGARAPAPAAPRADAHQRARRTPSRASSSPCRMRWPWARWRPAPAAPRHAAGVPVLQLAAGDEHKRKVGIGLLGRRDHTGRHQREAARGRGEFLGEDDGLAGVIGAEAGVGHAGLALQPVPGDALDAGVHGLAHFVVHGGHAAGTAPSGGRDSFGPGSRAKAGTAPSGGSPSAERGGLLARHLLDDPQVRPRVARRVSARRPICTMRSVLLTVPVFSGQALAGSTTSASQAVSVMKMSCTTRCSGWPARGARGSGRGRSWPGSRP